MFLPSERRNEIVEMLKKEFPKGTDVKLLRMSDSYEELPIGTKGKVRLVDDLATIHVDWDNGSSLGVVYGVDEIEKVS